MLSNEPEVLALVEANSVAREMQAPTKTNEHTIGIAQSIKDPVSLHVTTKQITDALEASRRLEIEQEVACTPAQEEFLSRESSSYRPWIIRLDLPGEIVRSYEQVCDAWHAISSHQQILRTTVVPVEVNGLVRYRQRVLKRPTQVRLGPLEEAQLSYNLHEPASLVFDGASGSTVYICIHPSLADRPSLGYLWKDFLSLLSGGQLASRLSFSKYSEIHNSRDIETIKRYWHDTLHNVGPLTLHTIPLDRHNSFRTTQSRATILPGDSALSQLSGKLGLSDVAGVIYTALWLTLSWHSQESSDTIVFAVEGRNRMVDGYESVVGFADQEYPLRLQLDPKLSAAEAFQQADRLNALASIHSSVGYNAIKSVHEAADCHVKVIISEEGESLEPVDSQFPITIRVRMGRRISVVARYDTAIPEGNMRVLVDHFATALTHVVDKPQLPLDDVEIISAEEQDFILKVGKPLTTPVYDNVHKIFERQVERTPSAPAAQFETEEPLTYDQLNRAANYVAQKLPANRGSFVPLCVHRSLNLVIALIAILKTGAAYVTLDPETPQERNQFIVGDVGADFVIVDRKTAGRFAHEVVIEDVIGDPRTVQGTNIDRYCEPSDPVYVIYTSGSTGKPKGVLHRHSSATSGLTAFPTLPNLRQLLFHNPVFSAAQRSVWSTLKQGGCLCLASKDNLTIHIGRTINQMRINVIDVTPSTALLITPGTVPCLRRMTVAGELINPALIPKWVDEVELLNAYGLSENTQVNWRREMVLGQNPQNIGRPSDTTSSFVMIPGTNRLSPLLVPGELCLGGHQLADHYINRPEKTAEAFIQNPFGPGRLYRTGDMVVAHEDGSVEMVGRIDFQVKINGQRVEPGDSNTIIQTHPDIYTSSVVSADVDGRKVLVGVVVPRRANLDWPTLRSELKSLLKLHIPGYMMPTYWLLEEELPLNINGKVDISHLVKYVESVGRDHLLQFSSDHYRVKQLPDRQPNEQPIGQLNGHANGLSNGHLKKHLNGESSVITDNDLSPAQLQLRDIWASTLSLPPTRISPHDYFQSLGGSSLDALRVLSMANEKGLSFLVSDILGLQLNQITLDAEHMDSDEAQSVIPPFSLLPSDAKLDRDNVEDAFPTTSLQEGFLADSMLGHSTYVYRRYYRIKNKQPADILAALEHLSSQHPVLRTTFVAHRTSFLQVIRKTAQLSWQNLDMTADEFSARPKQSVQHGDNFVHFACLRNDVLVVTVHHALLDYWSNSFLMDDLAATVMGRPLVARPSYANFIHFTQKQNHAELEKFWQDKMRNVVPILLGGKEVGNKAVYARLNDDFQKFASDNKLSLGSLIYAAWAIVLSLHTAKEEVVFGVTLSGRDVPVRDITRISGPTVSTVPFWVQTNPELTLIELARIIQEGVWEISPRAQFGLRKILRASGHKTAVFDTIVNVLIRESETNSTIKNDVLEPFPPYEPNFLDQTMLEAESIPGGLELRLLSSLPHSRANFVLGNVVETLKTALRFPSLEIAKVNPTSRAEEIFLNSLPQQLPTPAGMLAHSLLETMAARYPDKVALQDLSGTKVSYRELQSAANNLAQHLQSAAVRHGDIIPVCMQKSVNTLIAVFGILKLGAAFTPLDPENPKQRNEFIMQDVGSRLAITDNANASVFEKFTGRILNMNEVHATLNTPTELEWIAPKFDPQSLAYVIYTSGSTGLPKGVQVSHSSVAASTEGMIEACKVDEEWHVLWFLNYVFDASYFDVFTVLGSGGTISIADQDTMINDLATCVNNFGVKQLMITPTISKLISPEDVPTLQALLVCGEPITPELSVTWASRMDVYNGYGPTEATILMTVSKVVPHGNLKSIGYPLKAVKASILHPDSLVPVPWSVIGELCVSGAQVAKGYLNRPELTSSAFLTTNDGSVVYRTGDYARWLPNGEIECLGRKDHQVKLNGFRIELGEIENAVLANAGDLVQTCVVSVAQIQRKKQIVVYYVPPEQPILELDDSEILYPKAVLDPAALLNRLKSLAHYMMPKVFLPFRSFPLLASGKINRKQLAGFAESLSPDDLARYASTASEMPVDSSSELSANEQVLRDAWADLFDVPGERLKTSDNFYNFGGDSIAAINLVSTLRRLGYTLSVNDALSSPSLREQAKLLKPTKLSTIKSAEFVVAGLVHDKLRAAGLEPTDIEDIYPCAPGQVEFLTQSNTKEQFWQLMTVRRLPRDFDLDQWVDLTTKLTEANQILRAMYLQQDENDPLSWLQVILKKPILDLAIKQCLIEDDKSAFVQAHWNKLFQLGKPFVRYLILQYQDGTMDLCTKLDHAMYDGTSLRIFDDQFAALREGRSPPKPTPFRAFVQYAQESNRSRMLSFWKSLLRDNSFSYPSQLPRPQIQGVVVANFTLPVDGFAQSAGVTTSIIFQTAYTILLSKLSASNDVTYDYLLTGRNVNMEDPQIINGTCANFLPFRSRLKSQTPLHSLLKETQSLFWKITDNGLVSLGDIYRSLGVNRSTHAAKTLFLFQPFEPAVGEQHHMRWIVMAMSKVTMFVNYAIMFEVFRDVHGHKLKMQYDDRVFTKEEAEGVLELYQRIVEMIVYSGNASTARIMGGI